MSLSHKVGAKSKPSFIIGVTRIGVNLIRGPNPGLIFVVRVDCEAIRIRNGEMAASFVELTSDAYDILEALMMRRQKPLEKLKARLETISW